MKPDDFPQLCTRDERGRSARTMNELREIDALARDFDDEMNAIDALLVGDEGDVLDALLGAIEDTGSNS